MKKLLCVILCVVFVLALSACGQKAADADPTSATTGNAIIDSNIVDIDDMMAVSSEVGTLYYPEKWNGTVTFTSDAGQLNASCEDVLLFTLYFGGESGEEFGTLHLSDGDKALRYEMYDISAAAAEDEDLYAMQEDINVIFQYLIKEGKLTVN